MAIFKYTIKSKSGAIKRGVIQAVNEQGVVELIKKDFYILEIKKIKKKKEKLTSFERINFTDHLASMMHAGTPIRDALEAYAEDGSKRMELMDTIIKTIEQGKKLSEAFSYYPEIFSPLYISLVKAGEQVGNLDETLSYLANELRREHEFVQRVKSAMFYPALVLSVAFGVIALIMTVVVPKISEITSNLGADAPFTTKLILNISKFSSQYGVFLLMLLIVLIFGLLAFSKTKQFKLKQAEYTLKLPILGNIVKKYTISRFLRVLSSSIKYGVPLTNAFEASEEVVGNLIYKNAFRNMIAKIQKGTALSLAISSQGSHLFPSLIVRTVKGAEKTGGLDSALARISTQYETEVDRDLKRMTELLEPIMVVVLGVIVLGIAMSVIAPIYQITSKIK